MKHLATLSLLLLTACSTAVAPTDPAAPPVDTMPMDHGEDSASSVMDDTAMRLNESPRHHEWVQVQNDERTIYTWVVYPQRSDTAPVVLVIHENRGLNDWARSLADQVAEAGYIAVAPDLLSGFSDEYSRTSDFPDEDAARDAIYELDADQVQSDLAAVADYAKSIAAGNGKLATAGFCWGGAQSFEFATNSDAADAVMVFYGTSPEDPAAYAAIDAPVYGFYGGNDERVNATIDTAETAMSSADKTYDVEIYDGAGHAFMRLGEAADADPANSAARSAAWSRIQAIMSELE